MPEMHLFIDTNAYLQFYRHTKDDAEVLNSLIEHVEHGDIVVHLPVHVLDECNRNRERELHNSTDAFKKAPLPGAYPRHMHGLALAAEYDEALERLGQVRNRLAAEATIKARTFELLVDQRLAKLTGIASRYPDDDAVFKRAIRRAQKGNPPGKKESIGDQYNWEMLLSNVPDVDLYVVSKDGDYASPLGGTDANGASYPNVFLSSEWKTTRTGKNLYLFSSIKDVLKHFEKTFANEAAPPVDAVEGQAEPAHPTAVAVPQAELVAAEPARGRRTPQDTVIRDAETISAIDNAVAALVHSSSFFETHQAVAALATMLHQLRKEDAEKLVNAAIDNNQIGWIVSDPDVRDFYQSLVNIFLLHLDGGLLDALLDKMGLLDESGHDEDEDPNW